MIIEIINYRYTKYFLLCIISLNILQVQARTENMADTLENYRSGKYALTVAYFGETITHPGLNFGIENILWEKRKSKLISSTNLDGYTQSRNHRAISLNLEGGYRRTASNGLYSDNFIGFG